MSAGERAPRTERLCAGQYWVAEGEGEGWVIEHEPLDPIVGRQGLPWVTVDRRGRIVAEHYTLADARAALPPVPAGRRRSLGALNERKPR